VKDLELKEVNRFNLKKLDPTGMESELHLSINNPNRFGFHLYPSEFEIKYSGISLGKAKLVKKVKIKGHEEKVYVFELKNDFSNMNFLEFTGLIQPGKFKNEINIKGDLKAGRILFRKKFKVDHTQEVSFN